MKKSATEKTYLSTKVKIGIFLLPWIFAWSTLRKGVGIVPRIISFWWLIACTVAVFSNPSDNPVKSSKNGEYTTTQTQESVTRKKEIIKTTATELYREYEKNEVAADNKYRSKYVEVSGVIGEIGKDFLDDIYITLPVSGLFGVQVFFNNEDNEIVANLNKGMNIKVVCRVDGKLGYVVCRDAAIPKQL